MELELFRKLVLEAFDGLPRAFRKRIENVGLEVEEGAMHEANQLILGRYHGVPLTLRTSWYGNVLPDRITIYQGSIEQVTQDPAAMKKLVQEVIKHEVGHYFGLEEEDMHD